MGLGNGKRYLPVGPAMLRGSRPEMSRCLGKKMNERCTKKMIS